MPGAKCEAPAMGMLVKSFLVHTNNPATTNITPAKVAEINA
jgi:hypothetical protein